MTLPYHSCLSAEPEYLPANERLRYFLGRHLTERDFTDADRYPLSHLRAHQWMLHGWGIITGLKVRQHDKKGCQDRWVIVEPGAAVDPYGRLIIVPKELAVCLADLPDATKCEPEEPEECCPPKQDCKGEVPTEPFLLCLTYSECLTELTPVLVSSACLGETEYGRVREGYGWARLPFEGASACWPADPCSPKGEEPKKKDCASPPGCDEALKPPLPCGCPVVPLALLVPREKDRPDDPYPFAIHMEGRRYLPGPLHPTTLTRICETSWPHGGQVCWTPSKDDPYLVVAVKLTAPLSCHTKVDGHIFRVGFVSSVYNFERKPLVASCADDIQLSEDRTEVFFRIDLTYCPNDLLMKVMEKEPTIYITLLCDFLIDECGRAVDGNHLGGKTPTGDGVAGGTFESWFTLVADEPRKKVEAQP